MAGYSNGRKKRENDGEYQKLREALKAGTPERLYVFHGQERYLLEDAVRRLRGMIPAGTEAFNHHRLDGRSLSLDELAGAVDALPAFSQMTLTEISDFDFGKMNEEVRRGLLGILSDIPDYGCVVFICDTVEFKLDGRVNANKELRRLMTVVEFMPQDETALIRWIARNFASADKRITKEAARRLIEMTGGLMTGIKTETEKLISYVSGDTVEARDIEAVVTPIPDAAAWELTDALLAGKGDAAMERLGELFRMEMEPHSIIYSVSAKLRQLLMAKICLEERTGIKDFMKLADIRFEFQARALYETARRTSLSKCARLCETAADTAYKLNSSSGDDEELLEELCSRILLLTGAVG